MLKARISKIVRSENLEVIVYFSNSALESANR